MAQIFDRLVPDARAFLSDLAQNNTRDWFLANKSRYDDSLKKPALALLDYVSADLEKAIGSPVNVKLFRPHRDIRFSKDKTPYHTHLHMLWASPDCSWFLGIAPDYISAGAGQFAFDKDGLLRWREGIASQHGEMTAATIAQMQSKGARMEAAELKRVPAPYDKDHPREDLLRRKGLTLWFDASEQDIEKDGLSNWIKAVFSELLPVQTALRSLL